MVGEVTLSITRSWVQSLSLPDERSNRETSRRIGFYSVYFVSLQGTEQNRTDLFRRKNIPLVSLYGKSNLIQHKYRVWRPGSCEWTLRSSSQATTQCQ